MWRTVFQRCKSWGRWMGCKGEWMFLCWACWSFVHDYRSCVPCVPWSGWREEAEATDQDSECEVISLLEVQQGFANDIRKARISCKNVEASVTLWWLGKKVKLAGKRSNWVNLVSGIAFQQRQRRCLGCGTRPCKTLSGQLCKLKVFPLERQSQTGAVTEGWWGEPNVHVEDIKRAWFG